MTALAPARDRSTPRHSLLPVAIKTPPCLPRCSGGRANDAQPLRKFSDAAFGFWVQCDTHNHLWRVASLQDTSFIGSPARTLLPDQRRSAGEASSH